MASSSSSKDKTLSYSNYPVVPLAPGTTVTKTIKTTWSVEDPAYKVTITDEATQRNKFVSDRHGNLGLNQEFLNKTTGSVRDKFEGTVDKFTRQESTKNGAVFGGGVENAAATMRLHVPTLEIKDSCEHRGHYREPVSYDSGREESDYYDRYDSSGREEYDYNDRYDSSGHGGYIDYHHSGNDLYDYDSDDDYY